MIGQVEQVAGSAAPKMRLPRKTDGSKYFTPGQIASRWAWHPESVRRAIRQRRIKAVVISRRLLVPVSEVERIENEGRIDPAAQVETGINQTEGTESIK